MQYIHMECNISSNVECRIYSEICIVMKQSSSRIAQMFIRQSSSRRGQKFSRQSSSRIAQMFIRLSSSRIVQMFIQHLLHLSCTGNKALSSTGNFEGNMNNPRVQICERPVIFSPHDPYTWTCSFLPSVKACL